MTKSEAVISVCTSIRAEINNGASVQQAFDAVMGEGAYMRLAGELYDELRARAA